jgi:hypothetical protein
MMAGFYGRTGIELEGDLITNLETLAAKVRPAALAAVQEGAEIIRAAAYNNANVSPGFIGNGVNGEHMRDEIKVVPYEYPTSVSARIQIDMSIIPYAAHQEFGPHGNAFLRRAIDESRSDVYDRIRTVFSAAIGADGKFRTAVRIRRFA